MMDNSWARLLALYRTAAALPPAERAALLDRECGDDPELRRELESLLDQPASVGLLTSDASIMLGPQGTHASDSQRTFIGERIGPYYVVSLLGAGGMGEVYRARDSRLGREVALKILPTAFATDPARLSRFEREARLLASLNHPNIAVIHGFENAAGRPAIVMELIEGQTLAEQLSTAGDHSTRPARDDAARRKRLSLEEALHLARQIADALEAAHERGIVHRDLKPANIKITPNRIVKVLDFGIAKNMFSDAEAPTAATLERTQTGVIIGTAAYMSPEQVRGASVDKRTDIWAFGCVLYEMLAGRRAFEGATVSDTLAAVLEREPDWRCLPAAIPPSVVRLLQQCLEKDSAGRRRDIADVRLDLIDPVQSSGTPAVAIGGPATARSRERVAWAIAALFATVAVALGARHYLSKETAPERVIQAIVPPPDGWVISSAQAPMRLAVSPDGTRIAFTASTVEPPVRTQLWVRRLDSLSAQPLAGTDNAMGPFWSPDSRALGFFADGKLKRIDASGGPPLALCDVTPGVGAPPGATWSQNGVILFASDGRLARVPAAGGTPTSVTDPAQGLVHHLPFFLPDGRHFLYRSAGGPAWLDSQIYVGSLDSNDRRFLVRDTAQAVFSQGHILYTRDGMLMAQPFDERRFELSGQAVPVAEQVLTGGGGASVFSVAPTGVLAYQQGPVQRGLRLTWVDRAGRRVAELDQGLYADLQLSSDGKRVAVSLAGDDAGARHIWIFERGLKTRFTSNGASENGAIWSPDDQRIIFSRTRADGGRDLIVKASTNVGDEQVLLADGAENSAASWSPDGQFVLFGRIGRETGQDLWVLPLGGDRKPRPFAASEAGEADGRFAPDGRWVAYRSGETGRPEIFIAPFPGPGKKTRVSGEGGANPKWRRDGRELFYLSGDTIMAVDVDLRGTEPVVRTPHALFRVSMAQAGVQSWYDVTPDGQQFLINAIRDTAGPIPFTVVSNWLAARKN
jgi:Tol biopolymer transport system component